MIKAQFRVEEWWTVDWRDLRWQTLLIALLATVVVSYGGHRLFTQYRLINPLLNEVRAVAAVRRADMTSNLGDLRLELELEPDLGGANLQSVLHKIDSILDRMAPTTNIVLVDNPNAKLLRAYHQMHFQIEEGMATGRFAAMALAIEEIADVLGVDYDLTVTQDHVLLRLSEQHYVLIVATARPGAEAGRMITATAGVLP